jgi:hypothetical protein
MWLQATVLESNGFDPVQDYLTSRNLTTRFVGVGRVILGAAEIAGRTTLGFRVSGLLNSDLCGGPEAETRTELVQARFAAGARALVGAQG